MWGIIVNNPYGINVPTLYDEHDIVAAWQMDARTLEWLCKELPQGDEITKSLRTLRDSARVALWDRRAK